MMRWDFLVDLRRISKTSGGGWSLCVQLFLLPPIIAWVLFQAFVNRGVPQDTVGQFLFFSTLYLFWVGVSQSWQGINGAVESGEWTYWVLGIRRQRRSYLKALLLHRCMLVSWVVVLFVATLFVCYWMYPWGWSRAFVAPFDEISGMSERKLSVPFLLRAFVEGEGGTYLLPGQRLQAWYLCWLFGSFALGLVMAGISGTVIGLGCSAICRKPKTSVFVAVSLLMLLTASSFTSLRATRGLQTKQAGDADSDVAFVIGSPTYLPIYFAWKGGRLWPTAYYEQLGRNGTPVPIESPFATWSQRLSLLSPQRYYFNVAHLCLPRLGYLSRGKQVTGDHEQKTDDHGFVKADERIPCHNARCGCVFCLGLVDSRPFDRGHDACDNCDKFSFWMTPSVEDEDFDDVPQGGICAEDVRILKGIWRNVLWWEIVSWAVLCCVLLAIFVMLPVRWRSYLNTLR